MTRSCNSLLLTLAAILMLPSLASAQRRPQPKIVAYMPNWVDLKTLAPGIDYAKLTHINIAFENPTDSGEMSFHPQDDLLISRAHDNHVLVSVSLGGGAESEDKKMQARYSDLLSDEKRPAFVAKLVDYLDKHHLDGIDVDLEGPAITKAYGPFIHDLATALKPKGKLLTAALSPGYGADNVPTTTFADLDFVNIMAYDATGPWEPKRPGQHSSLDFAKQSVQYFLNRGLSRSKAVLGVPFFGYGFGEAFRKHDYAYSSLLRSYLGAEKLDQVGSTIYYNGIPTIRAKAQYAMQERLAGIMIWELDYDVKGEKSLLTAVYDGLRTLPPGLPGD